jgi:hypothetical protein
MALTADLIPVKGLIGSIVDAISVNRATSIAFGALTCEVTGEAVPLVPSVTGTAIVTHIVGTGRLCVTVVGAQRALIKVITGHTVCVELIASITATVEAP